MAPTSERVSISTTPVQHSKHYYQIFERPEGIEWDDAKTESESLGGYLVIINDAEENAFLTSIGPVMDCFLWAPARSQRASGVGSMERP